MKALIYLACLLLSLPNLLAGTASLIIRHTFATFHPLRIVTDFVFQVVWGLPLAGALFLLLLVVGFVARTRPYAALCTFILNATALAFVLSRFGLPHDFNQTIVFVPMLLAQIGFAWLACPVFGSSARH